MSGLVTSPRSTAGRGAIRHLRGDGKRTLCGEHILATWSPGDAGSLRTCSHCDVIQRRVDLSPIRELRCLECRRPFKQKRRGRPADMCSQRCYLDHRARRSREKRVEKTGRVENSPVERAHRKELRHWMRTGEHGPAINSRSPPDIIAKWINHSCRVCP